MDLGPSGLTFELVTTFEEVAGNAYNVFHTIQAQFISPPPQILQAPPYGGAWNPPPQMQLPLLQGDILGQPVGVFPPRFPVLMYPGQLHW